MLSLVSNSLVRGLSHGATTSSGTFPARVRSTRETPGRMRSTSLGVKVRFASTARVTWMPWMPWMSMAPSTSCCGSAKLPPDTTRFDLATVQEAGRRS